MIEVEATDRGVRATDSAKTSVEVGTDGWEPTTEQLSLRKTTDATVSGETRRLEFPPVLAVATRQSDGKSFELGSEVGPVELPPAEYVLRVEGNVLTYVCFDGPATLSKPGYEEVVLEFPASTTVKLGFRSRVQVPAETVVVPETPEGMAVALSQFPAGHQTTTADRSFPTMRGHPPLVEFGDAVRVPETVLTRREDTGVRFHLPASYEYLFPSASLAHYLGACVEVGPDTDPAIETPNRTIPLPRQPDFQLETAALLRRTFLLDCLVRNAGPHRTNLAEQRFLDDLDLDAAALYDASIGDRFLTYLDAPFEVVSEDLPEWHLSMYVDPDVTYLRTLPYLLYNVPNFFLTSSQSLEGEERLSRSLDDFYRGRSGARTGAAAGDPPSVDLLNPRLGPGRVHGWLGDGVPIDVFRAIPEAYENRTKYFGRTDEPISIVAILNDNGMADEHADAARIYRERATELDIDIVVREHLSVEELAAVFETDHDFVHYIGHCEDAGLRCVDGHLSASSLSESNAQTFFLNACGSYYEGVDLIRKGSVAGAVTFNKVLDTHAARVGTMFARLLINGFCLEQALQKARRRIIMGKDYTVVGDGTHVLTQSDNYVAPDVRLEREDADRFRIHYNVHSPWINGSYYQPHLQSGNESYLLGTGRTFTVSRAELVEFLEHGNLPVVYDGDIHWSDALYRQLSGDTTG